MKLGFIGTGKITSSVVTGICRSNLSFNKIILSPRSKAVSQKLKKKFKKIDTLINVAGFTERGTILSTTLDNYEKNFNLLT